MATACLKTITQNNSNNSLTPEFKWTLFKKRNNLDELINIPAKAEERSVIQISSRTLDPNIKTGQIRIPCQKLHLFHDPVCFQNPPIRSIYCKNPQSVHFLKCIWQIFFICSIKSPQCTDKYSKKVFFHSDFPSPCFDVPKASNFTSGGVQNQIQVSKPHEKQISATFSYFLINSALLYHFLAID